MLRGRLTQSNPHKVWLATALTGKVHPVGSCDGDYYMFSACLCLSMVEGILHVRRTVGTTVRQHLAQQQRRVIMNKIWINGSRLRSGFCSRHTAYP